MINSKALILLKTLDSVELKEFKRYLNRHFKTENLIRKIFQYYVQKKDLADTQPRILNLPIVYQKIIKRPLDSKGRKVYLNALHNLNKALKQFLLWKELEKDSFEKDQLLIKIFQKRKLNKFVRQTIDQRVQKIKTTSIKSQWHPLQLMQLGHHAYFENYEDYFADKAALLQGLMTNLDQFYSTLKMYYTCEMKNRSSIIPESYQFPFKEEILKYVKSNFANTDELAYLYYLCYELALKGQEAQYKQLQKHLIANEQQFSLDDQQFAYALIVTFLIRVYRKGNKTHSNTLFELYKSSLKKGYFFYNGQIPSNSFQNIVITALTIKKYDWAKKFIKEYQSYLPPTIKAPTISLAEAFVSFREADFKKVLLLINQVVFEDITFELRARALILRSFYELKENEELIQDYCISFQKFLKGNRHIQSAISNSYLVLIKYIKLFLKHPKKLTNSEIIEQIKAEKALQFHEWLIEKANQLS